MIRGRQVLLDAVLADLYGVTTKALLLALRRNADRFPCTISPDWTHPISCDGHHLISWVRDHLRATVGLVRGCPDGSSVAAVNELSRRVDTHDSAIRELLKTISQLVEEPAPKNRPIEFTADREGVEPQHPGET